VKGVSAGQGNSAVAASVFHAYGAVATRGALLARGCGDRFKHRMMMVVVMIGLCRGRMRRRSGPGFRTHDHIRPPTRLRDEVVRESSPSQIGLAVDSLNASNMRRVVSSVRSMRMRRLASPGSQCPTSSPRRKRAPVSWAPKRRHDGRGDVPVTSRRDVAELNPRGKLPCDELPWADGG